MCFLTWCKCKQTSPLQWIFNKEKRLFLFKSDSIATPFSFLLYYHFEYTDGLASSIFIALVWFLYLM